MLDGTIGVGFKDEFPLTIIISSLISGTPPVFGGVARYAVPSVNAGMRGVTGIVSRPELPLVRRCTFALSAAESNEGLLGSTCSAAAAVGFFPRAATAAKAGGSLALYMV